MQIVPYKFTLSLKFFVFNFLIFKKDFEHLKVMRNVTFQMCQSCLLIFHFVCWNPPLSRSVDFSCFKNPSTNRVLSTNRGSTNRRMNCIWFLNWQSSLSVKSELSLQSKFLWQSGERGLQIAQSKRYININVSGKTKYVLRYEFIEKICVTKIYHS